MEAVGVITVREREILESLLVGATAREIASELSLSVHTVRTHIRNIYRKAGLCNRVELVHWSLKRETRVANEFDR